jgi:hypothetical protein
MTTNTAVELNINLMALGSAGGTNVVKTVDELVRLIKPIPQDLTSLYVKCVEAMLENAALFSAFCSTFEVEDHPGYSLHYTTRHQLASIRKIALRVSVCAALALVELKSGESLGSVSYQTLLRDHYTTLRSAMDSFVSGAVRGDGIIDQNRDDVSKAFRDAVPLGDNDYKSELED